MQGIISNLMQATSYAYRGTACGKLCDNHGLKAAGIHPLARPAARQPAVKLLAIDTTTEACSAALCIEGEILEKYEVAPRRHAELILPMLDALLSEAESSLASLDALAFARGPGAFTGVRLGTSIIQGLSYSSGLPVVPVSTLAALAQGVTAGPGTILSAIDARMGEIYWGLFAFTPRGRVAALTPEAVSKPEDLEISAGGEMFGVGTGWDSYGEILSARVGEHLQGCKPRQLPRAADVLRLARAEFEAGNAVCAAGALPVYLRNRVTA